MELETVMLRKVIQSVFISEKLRILPFIVKCSTIFNTLYKVYDIYKRGT